MIKMTFPVCFLRILNRFRSHQDGSAAVEFALILPIFVVMLAAMMQIPIVFAAGQHLENATANVGRLIQTGQAQAQKLSPAQFRSVLCDKMGSFLRCDNSNILIEVQTLADFGSIPRGSPVDADGEFKAREIYQPGKAGEIVLVRVFYKFPIWLWTLTPMFSNLPKGKRLLVSSIVFQNEPF